MKTEAVPKLQFWNSNLGFKGKSGAFDRFFQELVSKPTGFWNKLNYLYIASLKGSDIIELFNFIATIPQGSGGFPQVSAELRYTVDYSEGTGKLRDLAIGGAPVDPNRTYRFCTNDYLLRGGDGYEILTRSVEPFNTSLLLSYVTIEYIRARNGVITPKTDGRITVTGGIDL